jgi:hypothetical protein
MFLKKLNDHWRLAGDIIETLFRALVVRPGRLLRQFGDTQRHGASIIANGRYTLTWRYLETLGPVWRQQRAGSRTHGIIIRADHRNTTTTSR